jgi:hypothetical protein
LYSYSYSYSYGHCYKSTSANHSRLSRPKPDPAVILDPSRSRRANSRLGLFATHLAQTQKPILELNTPFSVERSSSSEDHAEIIADESRQILEVQQAEALKEQEKNQLSKEEAHLPVVMSTQAPHPAVLIPGPVEFDDAVLQSMAHFRYVPSLLLESSHYIMG